MKLPTGEYFGQTDRHFEHGGVRISTTRYQPNLEQPWHTHETATFFAHLTGDQVDEVNSNIIDLPRLGVTYHSSTTPHRSRLGPHGAKGINVAVTDQWLEDHDIAKPDLGSHRVASSPCIGAAVLTLIRAYTADALSDLDLSNIALELIEGFLDPGDAHEPDPPRWLRGTEERLHANFRNPIGLKSLAWEAAVHPVHLARVFRAKHGVSVTDYVHRLRLQAAVDQILQGDSIGNAAAEAGFSDQFHFSRMLKAHHGYRPICLKQLAAS